MAVIIFKEPRERLGEGQSGLNGLSCVKLTKPSTRWTFEWLNKRLEDQRSRSKEKKHGNKDKDKLDQWSMSMPNQQFKKLGSP